jgi:ELWxxDGT repeat protein
MKRILFGGVWLFTILLASAQVTQLNNNKSLDALSALNTVKTLFASGADKSLWVSEGTLETTLQISNTILYQGDGMLLGNRYIFSGSSAATGSELFITDGTPAGTNLIKDILIGNAGSDPAEFALLNGYLYFTAATDAFGRELWRTDGTSAGTTLVKDINPGSIASNLKGDYNLYSTGTYLLFSAQGNQEGMELWKSDGTVNGTVMVKAINPGDASSSPANFFQYDGNVALFTPAPNFIALTAQRTVLFFSKTFFRERGTLQILRFYLDLDSRFSPGLFPSTTNCFLWPIMVPILLYCIVQMPVV